MGKNREIGVRNQLPWHFPEDLKFFKKTTLGHHILMGRKTFESIRRPLKDRVNMVLTRDKALEKKGCVVVNCLEDAFNLAREAGEKELMICGGASIFKQAFPFVNRIYLSKIDFSGEADCYFPDFDLTNWTQVHKEVFDTPIPWSIQVLEK
jgi:dihydrofolate reductase